MVFWVMILCACVLNVWKQEINADSCFYIAVSRLLNDGLVPFVDFSPGYTPLSFYIMQVPQLFVGQSYGALLGILTCIQLFNAFLLYRISHKVSGSLNLSQFAAILFMMLSLMWSEEYILEPFILLFGFLSMLCWDKSATKYLLLTGFLCFCSFWSKQYGIGFLILAFVYRLWQDSFSKRALKDCGLIFAGFLAGTVFFVGILLVQGVSLSDFAKFGGSNYVKDGLNGLIEGYVLLFKMLPLFIMPVILSCLRFRESIRSSVIVVAWGGVIGFMLQCYIRLYAHYLMLAIPFCALLFIAVVTLIRKQDNRTWYKIMLVVVLLLPLRFFVPGRLAMIHSDKKQNQIECASQTGQIIPVGADNVFASQDMLYVTLLNTYTPPLIDKYGLSNGFVRKSEDILILCQNADYCIIGAEEAHNRRRFTDEVNAYLEQSFTSFPLYNPNGDLIGNILVRK